MPATDLIDVKPADPLATRSPRLLTLSSQKARVAVGDTSLRAGLTRAILLPVTSVAALYTAHLELATLGASGFGVLTLLLGITLLLPFADLGIGAAVTNAVAGRVTSARPGRIVASSLLLLALAACALVAVASVLTATGLWHGITGVASHEVPGLDRDMLLVVALFGLGLPLAVGGRILLGLDRYPLFLVIQAAVPFTTLGIVYWFRDSRVMTPFLLAPFIAQLLASLTALGVGLHHLRLRPGRRWVRADNAPRSSIHREIRRTAIPMMLVTIGLPIALQTDRLVLSHVSTRSALSQYAIVAMLYVPAWSVISSAGMSLWPKFAKMRSDSGIAQVQAYRRAFRVFVLTGGVGAAALIVLGPLVTKAWAGSSGGGLVLWSAFALLLLVQSSHLPGGMFLTQPAGLRFQAVCVAAMCAANLPVSIVLARAVGAAGPVLASAATILVFQLVAARRRILGQGVRT